MTTGTSIAKKMIQIQDELKAPKNLYNSFGKYAYRSCEGILEAAKPVCKKYGCLLYLSDELEEKRDRIYVRATATVIDSETGETISNCAYAREPETKKGMDESQITGTASSYARKYALSGLFDIDDNKDPDTDEYQIEREARQKKPVQNDPKINPQQMEQITSYAQEVDVPIEAILNRFKLNTLQDMTMTQFISATKMLEATEKGRR